jgi:anti-anti-sigma factor
MKHAGYAAYSVGDHGRVQLGIREIECTPPDDVPGISVRFTITANLVSTNAPVLKAKALDAIARSHVFLAVDLSGCPYLDRRGYEVLASIGAACRRAGGELCVERASEDLRTLFTATSIDKLFTLSPEELR